MNNTTAPAPVKVLTVADIELGYYHPEYLGFGYLGERARAMATEAGRMRAAAADALLLEVANDEDGWTDVELFAWTNSKPGRWYGDVAFGGGDLATEGRRMIRKLR